MGIVDAVLGEGGNVKTKQEPLLNPQQQRLLRKTIRGVNYGIDNAEALAPQLNPAEVMSLKGLEGLAATYSDPRLAQQGGEGAVLDRAGQTLQQAQTDGPQDIDQYFRKTVQDPLVSQFTEEILPQIRASYGNNFYGGERMFKEGRATGDLAETLARERTRVAFEERNRAKELGLQAAGLSPELASAMARSPFERGAFQADQLGQILQLAGVERSQRAGELDYKSQQQNLMLNLLGLRTFENITENRSGSPGLLPSLIEGGSRVGAAAVAGGY